MGPMGSYSFITIISRARSRIAIALNQIFKDL